MATADTDAWGDPEVLADYATEGPYDEGERTAIEHLAPYLPGSRFLDVGVGGGRTATMLADRVGTYCGIDNSPGMVELAQARFPDLDLRFGDASALTDFADGSIDLLLFSLNGLDCLDPPDRIRALREFARVVVSGGRVVISTFSIDGPCYGETPDRRAARSGRLGELRRTLRRKTTDRKEIAEQRRAYAAAAARITSGEGWATAPTAAHGFRFLLRFARLDVVIAEFVEAGFDVEAAWTPEGEPIDLSGRVVADYYYVSAVRR